MKVRLKLEDGSRKQITLAKGVTVFVGIDELPYNYLKFNFYDKIQKQYPENELPHIFKSADCSLPPKDKVSLVRNIRETFNDKKSVLFTVCPEVLCSVDKHLDKVFMISEKGVEEYKGVDLRLLSVGEIASRIFEVDSIYPDIYNKEICEYHYLLANPFRDEEDNKKLNDLKEKLDSLNILV